MNLLTVLAHEGERIEKVVPTLDAMIRTNSLSYTLLALGVLALLIVISLILKEKNDLIKAMLFGLITLIVLTNTVYLVSSTIYLNQQSITGGPVHWHADFKIFKCGQEIELKNPEGLSNKVGSEVIHEHNDKRIHIEGVLLDEHDASIGHFLENVGGKMTKDRLEVPSELGIITMRDGQSCPSGQRGHLQVFVYQTRGQIFHQKKLADPAGYTITPEANIPPGDCIIVEFDPQVKDQTDKLCEQYQVKERLGEIKRAN